jgi:hypothetical protein
VKTGDVPQDATPALLGMGKALYAVGADGSYELVRSTGWEAEDIVLTQALDEVARHTHDALTRARAGATSPLEYHMYRSRMDVLVLAQTTGFFKWQVKRHLRADLFARLSERTRARYASALGLSLAQLNALPEAT